MLDRIQLTNFKAFRQAEIPLRPLTLLTGLNSSGKSTVMQSLALIKQSSLAAMLGPGGGLLLNGSLIELGAGRDVLHADWVEDDEIDGEYIRVGVDVDGVPYRWTLAYEATTDKLDMLSADISGAAEHSLLSAQPGGFQYLRADRVSPAAIYERSHEVAIRQGFLGAHGEHTVNYLRHHQDDTDVTEPLQHPAARSATLLSQAEAWLGEISPGVNLEAVGIDGTDHVRLSYGFGGTAGLSSSNRRRPTNVGFGLTYTLPIVVACLSARPGTLLLLENPEAHLHPRGQTQIAFLLARAVAAGAQVIVETHSDHILNGVRLAVKEQTHPISADDVQLHYFRQTQPGGVEILSPVIASDGMLSDWPEGFFDEWDTTLDRLLD
ncbi:putative ATPase [Spinactinospora alkalitolerans]|uniref:Putative ATPase n=1 Tax=Spinactinospora alkalitolerans TaxID=687207 RepID=A0A852TR21_9ACTN|nr:DUF3696 domain-containing protein [Spinactinospora alkalitolerans]NYE46015.1 putative ATPase [Spinactinospora alkalitolerans]